MRRIALLLALGAAVAVTPGSVAATVQVSITRAGFVPANVTVGAGDTVTWTNADTRNRQVVSQQAGFASPVLTPGQMFSFTFNRSGSFRYEDPLVQPRQRGTVTARAAVTIQARPQAVTYGRSTVLSGRVSSGRANEAVSITAQKCPDAAFAKIGDVRTVADGLWSFTTKPLAHTTYRAQTGNVTSGDARVRVRPRIRLGKLAPRKYRVRVFASESFAGRTVVLRRWNPARRTWVRVRSVRLVDTGLGVAPTQISGRDFGARIRSGQRVRITMSQQAAGGCFHGSVSNIVRS